MGRKSSLNEEDWQKIGKRLLSGNESARSLAREFGTSEMSVRRKFPSQRKDIKDLAKQMLEVDEKFSSLKIASQIDVITLFDELKSMSLHLASAGKIGAQTSHRLSIIANRNANRIGYDENLEDHEQTLKSILVATRGANDASQIGLAMITANKAAFEKSAPSDKITEIEMRVIDAREINE